MALNTNAPYSGIVEYAMVGGAAFGVIPGGGYEVNANLRTATGIAGQRVNRGGVVAATVNFDCQNVIKTYMSDMLRATPATSVAAKTFLFGNSDSEWTYTDCQPGGFRFGGRVDALPTCNLQYWAKTPSQTTTGNTQAAVSGGLTDNWSDFDILLASVDYACQGFEVALNTNPYAYTTLDSRATGSKRLPVSILLGDQTITCSLDFSKQIAVATAGIIADAVSNALGIVIAGSGVTFTLANMNTPPEGGTFNEALKVWRYTFTQNVWHPLTMS